MTKLWVTLGLWVIGLVAWALFLAVPPPFTTSSCANPVSADIPCPAGGVVTTTLAPIPTTTSTSVTTTTSTSTTTSTTPSDFCWGNSSNPPPNNLLQLNKKRTSPFVASVTQPVLTLSAWVAGGSADAPVRAVVYADVAGLPTALVAYTPATQSHIIRAFDVPQWVTLQLADLTGGIWTPAQGVTYHLGLWNGGTLGSEGSYTISSGGGHWIQVGSSVYSDTTPPADPFGNAGNFLGSMAIYAVCTPTTTTTSTSSSTTTSTSTSTSTSSSSTSTTSTSATTLPGETSTTSTSTTTTTSTSTSSTTSTSSSTTTSTSSTTSTTLTGTAVVAATCGNYDGTNWINPANVCSDDDAGAYAAYFSNTNNFLTIASLGFDIPLGAVITGIGVRVKGCGTGPNPVDRRIKLAITTDGGTSQCGAAKIGLNQPLCPTFGNTIFGGAGDLWSCSLSAQVASSPGFGIRLYDNDLVASELREQYLEAILFYNDPVPTTTSSTSTSTSSSTSTSTSSSTTTSTSSTTSTTTGFSANWTDNPTYFRAEWNLQNPPNWGVLTTGDPTLCASAACDLGTAGAPTDNTAGPLPTGFAHSFHTRAGQGVGLNGLDYLVKGSPTTALSFNGAITLSGWVRTAMTVPLPNPPGVAHFWGNAHATAQGTRQEWWFDGTRHFRWGDGNPLTLNDYEAVLAAPIANQWAFVWERWACGALPGGGTGTAGQFAGPVGAPHNYSVTATPYNGTDQPFVCQNAQGAQYFHIGGQPQSGDVDYIDVALAPVALSDASLCRVCACGWDGTQCGCVGGGTVYATRGRRDTFCGGCSFGSPEIPCNQADPTVFVPSATTTTTSTAPAGSTTTTTSTIIIPSQVANATAVWRLEENGAVTRVNAEGTASRNMGFSGGIANSTTHMEGNFSNLFDGIQYLGDSIDTTLSSPTTPFSWGCWLRATAANGGGGGMNVLANNDLANAGGYRLGYSAAIPAGFCTTKGAAGSAQQLAPSTTALNTWVHIGCGVDTGQGNLSIWKDGLPGATATVTNLYDPPPAASELQIGGPQAATKFTGQIDECFLAPHLLSDAEWCFICSCGWTNDASCTWDGSSYPNSGRNVLSCNSCTLPSGAHPIQ